MNHRSVFAVLAGLAAIAVVGVSMSKLSYDVWGAVVLAPVLACATVPLVRRGFGQRYPELLPFLWVGLGAKLLGAVLGYVVRFDAYGGTADAGRYHNAGRLLAEGVRSGERSPFMLLPTSTDTAFIEQVNGLVYTIVGSSLVGGFLVFAWLSFLGTLLVLRGALDAVPGLGRRRLACVLMFSPSLMYWGSSPGKEAVVGLLLGMVAYGASILLAQQQRWRSGAIWCVVGLGLVARIRPHFAAIWAAALVAALVIKLLRESLRRGGGDRRFSKAAVVVLIVVGAVGFVGISMVTLAVLDPPGEDDVSVSVTDRVTDIFERTQDQTSQGGSNFETVSIANPLNWPVAAIRTLTRPLLFEARSIAEMLPAVEMTVLLGLLAASWRRLRTLPHLVARDPYLVFVLLAVLMFGVAFSSIANLGILVRQRSLVLPLMLILWCLPLEVRPRRLAQRPDSSDVWASPAASARIRPVGVSR